MLKNEKLRKDRSRQMSKVAVVYWSGTGNTETMAHAVADGARKAGASSVDELPAGRC